MTNTLTPQTKTATNLFSISDLRKEVDRLFNSFNRDFTPVPGLAAGFDFMPDAELAENGEVATIRVELPGVHEKDIDISTEDHTLTISGHKKSESEEKKGDMVRSERSFGSFSRAFGFPFVIDADKVHANFENGVLTVKIAKPAGTAAKSRKIAIGH
ncbi:MAG TPA: Hsp20/alpha crystallin family protein [Devosia sp.]|nr:Hsp20/alpha crystallin family protein [Devosia sp.]